MKGIAYAECETCSHRTRVELSTDGNGRLVERMVDPCEHQRRAHGICLDCPDPVRSRLAWRCAPCAKVAMRRAQQAWNRKPEVVAARKEKDRARHAANREIENERKRARRAVKPDKVRTFKPGTPEYERRQEQQKRTRERRREAIRAYRRKYYEANREALLAYARETRELQRRIKQRKAA